MDTILKKSFFGLNIKETNNYIEDLALELEKEKSEYSDLLRVIEKECKILEDSCSEIEQQLEKQINPSQKISDDIVPLLNIKEPSISSTEPEITDVFDNFIANENKKLKQLLQLKVKYESTNAYYRDQLKQILNKYRNY